MSMKHDARQVSCCSCASALRWKCWCCWRIDDNHNNHNNNHHHRAASSLSPTNAQPIECRLHPNGALEFVRELILSQDKDDGEGRMERS
mmetsp:Transcript_19232/g.45344  ORF Transcript_19232/g.45344 Transcript_19232/m.45344 type:complete len:89 (-) Transcript_19232:208-474(-)